MQATQSLISISECLSLWAKESSIELRDKSKSTSSKRRLKIGRDSSGKLLSVGFEYLDNKDIEIYSARRIK